MQMSIVIFQIVILEWPELTYSKKKKKKVTD